MQRLTISHMHHKSGNDLEWIQESQWRPQGREQAQLDEIHIQQ